MTESNTDSISIPRHVDPSRPGTIAYGSVYLSPFIKCTGMSYDVDDAGTPWGFSEYCELLADPDSTLQEAAKALDAAAGRLVVKWSRVTPYPHYRVTRQRALEISRAGCVRVDATRAEEIRAAWEAK